MAAYLSPILNEPWIDSNGNPLSGGLVYTYIAGTTTPAATYTDNTGVTPQANPIVLGSNGLPANPIWIAGGSSIKFVIKTSVGVTLQTYDNVQGINDPAFVSTQDQWVALGITPTFVSTTSFSVPGDQTTILQVGRRLKTANTGGTIYSTITASSYAPGPALTTVTVVNDSGVLDAGLSAASYGLLSQSNHSLPIRATVNSAAMQATTAGTSIDFLNVPPGVKRITIPFVSVSTNGNSPIMAQIGTSGGVVAVGYLGAVSQLPNAAAIVSTNFTTGFGAVAANQATSVIHGTMTLILADATTNTWAATTSMGFSDSAQTHVGGGSKALAGTLDRVRITTVGGANTFDLGSIGLLYE